MTRTLPGLLALLLALSACAAPGGQPDPSASTSEGRASTRPSPSDGDGGDGGGENGTGGGIEHPTGSDPILVVSLAGGMLPLQMQVTQLPQLVILGDGRVIAQGMQTLEFPGPILPPLIEHRLTEEGIQAVLAALDATNLFAGHVELRGMQNVVADAPDTIFTVDAGGTRSTVTVYALGMVTPDMEAPPGVDEAELDAHAVLQALNDRLMTLDTWLPADAFAASGWQDYRPDAFRLYVRDVTGQPIEGGDLEGQVRQWPTEEDPAAFGDEVALFADGTRCAVVDGEAGAAWFAELSNANQNTLWTDDGERRFSIAVRPLLPHEERACPEPRG